MRDFGSPSRPAIPGSIILNVQQSDDWQRVARVSFFRGVALPRPDRAGSDAEAQKNHHTHNDPVLGHVHQVRTVSQSGDENQIADEVQCKRHFLHPLHR